MIVVAVVAILAAIALPSYQDSVRKSRRGQAKADLLELTQMLERRYTTNRSYEGFTVPAGYDQSPHEGTAYYVITGIDEVEAGTYELTATPQGGQTGDRCGTLTINHMGVKTQSGSGTTVSDCW
jgi:type IV pilus assembly protein PilE